MFCATYQLEDEIKRDTTQKVCNKVTKYIILPHGFRVHHHDIVFVDVSGEEIHPQVNHKDELEDDVQTIEKVIEIGPPQGKRKSEDKNQTAKGCEQIPNHT